MGDRAVIGIDLGGTKLAGALFTPAGRIINRSLASLAGRTGSEVGRLICEHIADLLRHARQNKLRVAAIGVSVPGISNSQTGRVWAPNIPGWKNYPLRREIVRAIRNEKIKVVIDGDRACCIFGELWRGAARRCKNAVFVAVGTGIGAGILIEGRVVRGAHDIAGAIGWLALDRPYRPEYRHCGCFEYHASGEGLAKVANALSCKPHYGKNKSRQWTAPDIFAGFARGDRLSKEVVRQAIQFWGMAVANLVSLLNPEKIIFGGGVFGPATQFLSSIRAEAEKWAQPISFQKVRLQPSRLGTDAGLYGAGYLALHASNPGEARYGT